MKKLLYFCLFCVSMMIVSCEGFEPGKPSDESDNPNIPVSPDKPSTPDKEGEEEEQQPISPEDPCLTDNAVFVSKPFSVSETEQVVFSQGNLQYSPANKEWRFAPSQLCYIGAENEYISPNYEGWIDLFGFGTGNNPTNISMNYKDDYNYIVDWGVNKIGNDAPYTWRSLSNVELHYLIEERANASELYATARVCGIDGLILLPDNWEAPTGVNLKPGVFKPTEEKSFQSFTNEEWMKLSESGVVFLPVAGDRANTEVKYAGEDGLYWTFYDDGYDGTSMEFLHIEAEGVTIGLSPRNVANSVRLVKDI